MNSRGIPVPDLSGAGRVNITSMQVLPVASVDVIPGGLSLPNMDLHLRVIKLPHGEAWLVPMDAAFARKVAGQLMRVANDIETDRIERSEHGSLD